MMSVFPAHRRGTVTLAIGLLLIVVPMVLVFFVDAPGRRWLAVPEVSPWDLPQPPDALGRWARWCAWNMTGICWVGYLLVFDGLLCKVGGGAGGGSPLRRRPNRFVVAWLTSIPVWCFFDWVNFYGMHAWDYHGLPPRFDQRIVGYFVAFAAISPGMFLAATLWQRLGLRRLAITGDDDRSARRRRRWSWFLTFGVLSLILLWVIGIDLQRRVATGDGLQPSIFWLIVPGLAALVLGVRRRTAAFVFGLFFSLWAIAVGDPVGNLTLWVGLIYLLDPIVEVLGGPSILRDWREGRYGRTLALMLGGGFCGLLWEMWNYFALAKWTYNLPFIGELEAIRYFEMPLIGFIGFFPFAIECWVMLNLIVALLDRAGLRLAEPLADDDGVM